MKQLVYTIRIGDVGQDVVFIDGQPTSTIDFLGCVQKQDVGKHVYRVGDVFQVENQEQLSARHGEKNQ